MKPEMTIDLNHLIGERVRFYRTSKGWSLEKLATSLQIKLSGQQLAKYETGVSRWPADLVCNIAVVLRTDVRLLLGLEDGKHEGKDSDEWEAEKHKNILLSMAPHARNFCYNTIQSMSKFKTGV